MLKKMNYIDFINKTTMIVEKVIITLLVVIMTILLGFAMLELFNTILVEVLKSKFIISLDQLIHIFGGVLLILIGIELLETIKIYLNQSIVHVEVVILVAIIALARKIIILEFEKTSFEMTIGMAILILVLSFSYFLIKKSGTLSFSVKKSKSTE